MVDPVSPVQTNTALPPPELSDRETSALIAANSTRSGVDTRSLAADLTGLSPSSRQAALEALAHRLTPTQQGELLRHLDAFEQAMPSSAPPPENRDLSLGDQVLDGGHQFGVGLWNTVKSLGSLAGGIARTSYDTSLSGMAADGIARLSGGRVPEWMPSAARGQARIGDAVSMMRQAGAAIWNDPSILMKEYKDLAHEGRYGAIVGQGLADFGDLLVGTHGVGAAAHGAEAVADIAKIAHGAGVIADAGKVAKASESAIALARAAKADAAFAERAAPAMEQARAALGAVDASHLTPEAREALTRAKSELEGALEAAAPRYLREAATEMPNVTSALGRKVIEVATKSPGLMSDLRTLEKANWKIVTGTEGAGSRASRASRTITLDPAMMKTPADAVRLLSHEVGHAKFLERANLSSRSAFVSQALRDEGAATIENIRVQREILAHGGGDIGIQGSKANHAAYNAIYDQFLKDGNLKAAQEAIGQHFATHEIASGTGGMNYSQYYNNAYSRLMPGRP